MLKFKIKIKISHFRDSVLRPAVYTQIRDRIFESEFINKNSYARFGVQQLKFNQNAPTSRSAFLLANFFMILSRSYSVSSTGLSVYVKTSFYTNQPNKVVCHRQCSQSLSRFRKVLTELMLVAYLVMLDIEVQSGVTLLQNVCLRRSVW